MQNNKGLGPKDDPAEVRYATLNINYSFYVAS
jgi:hypothetical protein